MVKKNHFIAFSAQKKPRPEIGCEYSIKGRRESMEDATVYAHWLWVSSSIIPIHLFGVFDGHGGPNASVLVSTRLPAIIYECLESVSLSHPEQVKNALIQSFIYMHSFMQHKYSNLFQKQGTTAVIVLCIQNVIYCANAGDSRAVMYSSISGSSNLSKDHKPNNPFEKLRIQRAGGFVSSAYRGEVPRVWESSHQQKIGLSTSRSLGDLESLTLEGTYLVSPIPDITVNILNPNETGFIILACDGLWDVMTTQQACREASKAIRTSKNPCQHLVRYAYHKGSTDNITVMLIKI